MPYEKSYALSEETGKACETILQMVLAPPLARLGWAKAPAPAGLTQTMRR